jgi:DnaJ-class molecular chaperone
MSKNKPKKKIKLIDCPECDGYGGDFECFDGHNPVLVKPCHMCGGVGSINKEDFSGVKINRKAGNDERA